MSNKIYIFKGISEMLDGFIMSFRQPLSLHKIVWLQENGPTN